MTRAAGRDSDRPRPITLIVLVVAVVASLATSPAHSELTHAVDGQPFILSPDHPEASVRFEVAARGETHGDARGGSVSLERTITYRDVADDVDLAAFPVEVSVEGPLETKVSAQLRGSSDCDPASCLSGEYEATFRWPEALDHGSARVTWSPTVWLSWDRSSPPGGAEATVSGVQHASLPAAATTIATGTLRGPLTVQDVTIHTLRPLPADALRLELPASDADRDPDGLQLFLLDDGPRALRHGTSTVLPLPTDCVSAPCTSTVRLVARARADDASSSASYELTVDGDEGVVEVVTEDRRPTTLPIPVPDLPPIELAPPTGDERTSSHELRLRMDVPAEAIAPDGELTAPLLGVTVTVQDPVGPDTSDVRVRGFGGRVRVHTPRDARIPRGRDDDVEHPVPLGAPFVRQHGTDELSDLADLPCLVDEPCTVDITVGVEMRWLRDATPRALTVSPEVQAELRYATAPISPDARFTLDLVEAP